MRVQIPVICNQPFCGAIWFTNSLFDLGPGATVSMSGNTVSPCPSCGGAGRIPDGEYTSTSASLFSSEDLSRVLQALQFLQKRAEAGASASELSQDIESQFPYLGALRQFLPRTPSDLAAYLALLVSICIHFSSSRETQQPPTVQVQVNVSQALNEVSEAAAQAPESTEPDKLKDVTSEASDE